MDDFDRGKNSILKAIRSRKGIARQATSDESRGAGITSKLYSVDLFFT
jgi:hypothetical protein